MRLSEQVPPAPPFLQLRTSYRSISPQFPTSLAVGIHGMFAMGGLGPKRTRLAITINVGLENHNSIAVELRCGPVLNTFLAPVFVERNRKSRIDNTAACFPFPLQQRSLIVCVDIPDPPPGQTSPGPATTPPRPGQESLLRMGQKAGQTKHRGSGTGGEPVCFD